MSYSWTTCYDSLISNGFNPCGGPDDQTICENISVDNPPYHAICQSSSSFYTPVQAIVCKNSATGEIQSFPTDQLFSKCFALQQQDPNWNLFSCYCCCSGMGFNTATVNSDLAVQHVQVGERTTAGSLTANGLVWTPSTVAFSSGTSEDEISGMLNLKWGESGSIVISHDHVLMVASGKLTTADQLKPGDLLMGANGESEKITSVSIVPPYSGGIHNISTKTDFDGTPNGHLINSSGIVSGDYTLQLNFNKLDAKYKAC